MRLARSAQLHSRDRSLYLQLGSSLIEVLVSLLILSGGLLGMAGVQSVSLRNNQAAYYRTMATNFTADMVERMRANKTGVGLDAYDNVAGAATAACFTTAGCTSAQMAAQDVLNWTNQIAAALPGAVAVVCLDSSGNDGTFDAVACDGLGATYAIKIFWDDNRDGTAESRYVTAWQPL
jgi:type IV pilus assembly protein PilV